MDTCTMKGRKIETVYKNSIRKTSESESNDKKAAEIFGDHSDKVTGLQFGITHKF